MTISQRVTWTFLPNGAKDAATLSASLYVSPRLSISTADVAAGKKPDLSHFSDWLEWPRRIADADYHVRVGNTTVPAKRVSPDPQATVWSALFPPSTPVHPYDFAGSDFSDKVVLSYPVATIYKNVRSIYGRIAALGSDMPTADQLELLARQSREYIDRVRSLQKPGGNPFDEIRSLAGTPTIVAPPPSLDRTDLFTALDLLTLFHRPLNKETQGSYTKKPELNPPDIHESVSWRTYNLAALPSPASLADEMDFHRIVAAIGQYYALLRMTGLVVDLEFPRPADGDAVMQAVVNWNPGHDVQTDEDLRPRIRTTLKGESFYAASRDIAQIAIVDRFLRLRQVGAQFYPRPVLFDLVEMDVDGAGMKLKNFLLGWQRAAQAQSYDDETEELLKLPPVSAPSLRSGGVMLANSRHDVDVSTLFKRNKALDSKLASTINNGSGNRANDDSLLSIEDVVRGYRADIYDAVRQRWFSLSMRDGAYTLRNTGDVFKAVGEEAMARLAAATSTDGTNPDIVKVHEGLFTWRGWSLAAPEPGNSLLAEIDPNADTSNPANVVGNGEAAVPDGLPLATSFTPTNGTLPSLRFGRSYKVRVRLADLAGNSAPFDEGDAQPEEAVSNPVTYRRYEPIESPALALVRGTGGLEKPAEGESMGRAAIRTFNDPYDAKIAATPDRVRRYIVPPRATHRFAETHGVMDGPDGKIDPNIYALLKSHDSPLDQETWKSADGTATLTYAVADENFALPYLPDPWALGVAFKVEGLQPQVDPNKVYVVPYYETGFAYSKTKRPDWPNARPFTIVISENGPHEPHFDAASRELRITMGKGERARVRVSSILPTIEIFSMAVAEMIIEQKLPKPEQDKIGVEIAEGQHWMFTPWRVIELVHAVQKPLIMPAFRHRITVDRQLGWTHAVPTIPLALHSKSTASIDVNAKWIEPNDDPTELVPLPQGYTGNKVRYPGPAGQPELTPADPGIINHAARAFELKIARLASVKNTFVVGGPLDPNATIDDRPQHVFGDTHYRRVTYQVDATTRFREFMPSAIQADPAKLTVSSPDSDPKGVAWIPNAAPPPTPKVLYVVPTFGWGRSTAANQSRSFRSGGGLRVYFDRPWFTTGFTEMLGVVLPPGPAFHNWAAFGEAQMLPPYVTQWGADPIWASGRVLTVAPQPDAFPLAKWRGPIAFDGAPAFPAEEGSDIPPGDFPVTGLHVPEFLQTADADPAMPGPLAVAPHAVSYDPERQLWYADIVVRPGDSYFPFIRLALARYNPVSIPGAHLSSVVMAEFVQLTPDRLAVVTQAGNKVHVAVYGTGTSAPAGPGPRSGLFDLSIETLAPGADHDLGWLATNAKSAPGLAEPRVAQPLLPTTAATGTLQSLGRTVLAQAADELIRRGDYTSLLKRSDLLDVVAPAFLWQGEIDVPGVPDGTRVRLVITESEVFQTADDNESMSITGSRVVYLETFELAPPHQIRTEPVPVPQIRPEPPPPPPPSLAPSRPARPLQPTVPLEPIRPLPRVQPNRPAENHAPAVVPPAIQPRPAPSPSQSPSVIPLMPAMQGSFTGDWNATRGRRGRFQWHLQQRGADVRGTYEPGSAIVEGTVDGRGRLNFTWTEHGAGNRVSASGRGYLDLVSPNEWRGRWWFGISPVDPTPRQPNIWQATRSPGPAIRSPSPAPGAMRPTIRLPLRKLQKR